MVSFVKANEKQATVEADTSTSKDVRFPNNVGNDTGEYWNDRVRLFNSGYRVAARYDGSDKSVVAFPPV